MAYGSPFAAGLGAMQQALVQREMAARQRRLDEQNELRTQSEIKIAEANIESLKAQREASAEASKSLKEEREQKVLEAKRTDFKKRFPLGAKGSVKAQTEAIELGLEDFFDQPQPATALQLGPAPGAVMATEPVVEPPPALMSNEAMVTPPTEAPSVETPAQDATGLISRGTMEQQSAVKTSKALRGATTREEVFDILLSQGLDPKMADELTNARMGPRAQQSPTALEYAEYKAALPPGSPAMSLEEYRTMDANRKRQPSGAPSETSTNRRVDSYVRSFESSPIVKRYNIATDAVDYANSIATESKSPADHQGLIYAFAKAMDPDSAVREGEYSTVQKYAQDWLSTTGFNMKRIFDGAEILTPEAIARLKEAIKLRAQPARGKYDNLYKETQRRIEKLDPDQIDMLPDYKRGTSDGAPVKKTAAELRAQYGKKP
jgi:hypothetical protein